MGERCLNTKINFFISRNTIYLLFLKFLSFWGGEIGRCPKVTAGSLWPARAPRASRAQGRQGPARPLCPPPGREDRRSAEGAAREAGSSCVGCADRNAQFSFCFIFVKEKGPARGAAPSYVILYVVSFCFVLFCKVYNFLNNLSFKKKKKKKSTKKILVKALRRVSASFRGHSAVGIK